jgi:hypothetical protein
MIKTLTRFTDWVAKHSNIELMFALLVVSVLLLQSCNVLHQILDFRSVWLRNCAEHRPLVDCKADVQELFGDEDPS